jgi:tetratricopeptide (TPR) repeat protein
VSAACIDILFGPDGNSRTSDPAQPERVASWFEQAIARAKSQKQPIRWLLTGLGNVRERQGRIPDAMESYRLAVQADARDGVSLNNLAWLMAFSKDEKQHKEALDYANRAISLAPDQDDFLDTRGMIHLINAQPKLALEDSLRAVAIDPSSPAKYFHLAQAYLAVGDKERAKQSLEAAKTKGLTPSSLHVLERGNYQSVFDALGSP